MRTSDQTPEKKKKDAEASDFLMMSHSTNFIKNKTGEILLFKAGKQPAFTEMPTNETLPLDF